MEVPGDVTVIRVEDTRYALALMSAAYFGYPANKLKIIGITGTKGKTTTTYMIRSILEEVGRKVGLIGTIEAIIGEKHIPAANTTPESYTIQKYFAEMVEAGCDTVVMEVSSQGLMLNRTAGIPFEIGIFTNLGKDHIGPNEHADFEDYKRCKGLLFKQCELGIANGDDPWFEDVFKEATCKVETFGFEEKNDLRAVDTRLVSRPGYLGVAYHVAGLMDFDVEIDVPGTFSVYNSLTAIAVCRHFGVPEEVIKSALKVAKVKGRIEMVKVSDEFTLMIDYAHNAMSLESLLTTLKEYHPSRLVCLFGCGGNRSKDRRYEMGEVSGRLARSDDHHIGQSSVRGSAGDHRRVAAARVLPGGLAARGVRPVSLGRGLRVLPLVPVPDHHFLTLQEPVHAAPVAHHQPCLRPGHLFAMA